MQIILIKPVFSDHLSYVTLFQCYLGRSHETGLTMSATAYKNGQIEYSMDRLKFI